MTAGGGTEILAGLSGAVAGGVEQPARTGGVPALHRSGSVT
ncbi:MAG: hypothetical protein SYR96_07755 [Actinomycetota bacterium]|nr:hypothetical protein [Actinomycetota bacterium]